MNAPTASFPFPMPVFRAAPEKKIGGAPEGGPQGNHTMQSIEAAPPVQLQHAAAFVREGFVTLNPAQANTILRECQYDR